ncbi:MAG: indolepyruvate oxidoreductase subunit beta [Thermodesulfobacteriota bacterium]
MKDVTRLIIVAVGGQGNLLASRVIGEAALASNVPIRMSEIHGMAQRGGVVESALVFGDAESSLISDGEADLLVGFEPVETLRALGKCNPETVVVTSLHRLSPFTVSAGKATYPPLKQIQELIRAKTKHLVAFDASEAARQAGNILSLNMVLTGAALQTGLLPVTADAVREVIRTKTKAAFVDVNLRAFELGFQAGERAAA